MTIRWAVYAPEDPARIDETVLMCRNPGEWLPSRYGDMLGLYWFATPDHASREQASHIARNWMQKRGLIP